MDDNRGASPGFYRKIRFSPYKKYLILTILVLFLFFLFSGGFGFVQSPEEEISFLDDGLCGDDTPENTCSDVKPYFCKEGILIEMASVCGCPEGFGTNKNICFSNYNTGYKNIRLNYTLKGENGFIDFAVYDGFRNYISSIPRSIVYFSNGNSSRADFTLKAINEEEQRKFLMPLVIIIQNITDNKDDQMRIAISIVQNIPFGASNKTAYFGVNKINYSRYPYEVLYDMQGVCGEKTDLLAFFLRELGYGTSFFYYADENHEALGLKCPIEESLSKSGYCFVETTGPSIITDNKISYVGVGKLFSEPEIYFINYGESISFNLDEYEDADKLIQIRNSAEKTGFIGPINKMNLEKIKKKYGLAERYYG